MCKRVVAGQGSSVSLSNTTNGLGGSINDGEYVRGRRRGELVKLLIKIIVTIIIGHILYILFSTHSFIIIGDKFIVTPQICLAINDIDYVLQFIDPFVRGNL